MDPVICPERSPPPKSFPRQSACSPSQRNRLNVSNLELSDNESTAGKTYPTPEAQLPLGWGASLVKVALVWARPQRRPQNSIG